MLDTIVVPLDGSAESARALRPAAALARYVDADLEAVAFHSQRSDGASLARRVQHQVDQCGDVRHQVHIAPLTEPVADLLTDCMDKSERNHLIVMNTRGRGRSAALVGSVAQDILRKSPDPVLLIGPACDVGQVRLNGSILIASDASSCTPAAIDAGIEASRIFGFEPTVVNVVHPDDARALAHAQAGPQGHDVVLDSAMAQRYARDVGRALDRSDIEFRVLHSTKPGRAIVELATESNAALVVMGTHARAGLDRLATGSVTADVVSRLPCPVLVVGPERAR